MLSKDSLKKICYKAAASIASKTFLDILKDGFHLVILRDIFPSDELIRNKPPSIAPGSIVSLFFSFEETTSVSSTKSKTDNQVIHIKSKKIIFNFLH
jgi:hypothetical protein